MVVYIPRTWFIYSFRPEKSQYTIDHFPDSRETQKCQVEQSLMWIFSPHMTLHFTFYFLKYT